MEELRKGLKWLKTTRRAMKDRVGERIKKRTSGGASGSNGVINRVDLL
jgi:hypothetical protein